ncbi:SRPBCC family protein [Novosphingobium sp.]|uniref:SRPBCC family protein n=1 Tax=Novosphingobium sp. TaxID=1874826 RepID=UPI003B52D3AA
MTAFRPVLAGLLIGMAANAVPAQADIVDQSAQGFASRNGVIVAATPAAVWKRLVTPAVWWSSDHTFSGDAANMSLDPVAGGCFCERLPGDMVKGAKGTVRGPSRGGVEHMRVVYAERGKALRMVGALGPLQSEGVSATLTVTLKEVDGGTRVIFEYVVGGYMRYPADKIQPAVDTVMANQLLSLAHGFAGVAGAQQVEQRAAAPQPAQDAAPQDAPAAGGQGLDKQGLLLPRGRIWSLPPSDGIPGPVPAPAALPPATPATALVGGPLHVDAIPQDVAPSGGGKPGSRRSRTAPRKAALAPVPADDSPLVEVPAPVAPAVVKKAGKAVRKTGKAATTTNPPKSDEPSTDTVNSEFDSAVGDPQRPVQTNPN